MKIVAYSSASISLLLLLCATLASTPAAAGMQWKWRDATGAIQYSDRAPPNDTPEANILQRPSGQKPRVSTPAATEADLAASAASKPATKATESDLDAKHRKAEQEKLAQQKAEEDKAAKIRAENCTQARNYQRTLNDGVRIARTNSKGEREILDDKGRAEEQRRTQDAIASNCK